MIIWYVGLDQIKGAKYREIEIGSIKDNKCEIFVVKSWWQWKNNIGFAYVGSDGRYDKPMYIEEVDIKDENRSICYLSWEDTFTLYFNLRNTSNKAINHFSVIPP